MADFPTPSFGGEDTAYPLVIPIPIAANTLIEGGRFVWTNASGYAIPSSAATASAVCWGISSSHQDNLTGTTQPGNSGAAGGATAEVTTGVAVVAGASDVTMASVGKYVYLYSDSGTTGPTVTIDDLGGSRPLVGVLIPNTFAAANVILPDAGMFCVFVGSASAYALNPLLASSGSFKARNVASSLPGTFTVTAGVLLADANGALGAQDGVTNAVGDVIIFPAGTVGSGTVTAANSGPWKLTAIGGASAKFAAVRPDWWPHGSNIVPGSVIDVGGEGTLNGGTEWKTWAAASVVIGTGDPALYPVKVTQQVQLASSTATITNVPIRSGSKDCIVANLATANGTLTGTVMYGAIVAPTAGALGTASAVVDAIASGQTKNGTADTSFINVTIFNG